MTEFQIRLAKISDVEPILAFCQYTWENQKDYMHLVLEKRINNPENKVFVVTLDDIPVAMQQVVILSKQEAWRSSLRVDRRYRRRGLSKLLYSHINKYLSQVNVPILRYCVYSDNEIMLKIISQRGDEKLDSYSLYQAATIASATNQLIQLDLNHFDDILSLIYNNILLDKKQSFYTKIITKCQTLTPELLKDCLVGGKVFGLRQNERLRGIAIQSYSELSEEEFYIGYLHGEPEILTVLLCELCKLAYSLGKSVVKGLFPLNDIFANALSQAAFQRINQAEIGIYRSSFKIDN
ncbi:MAG: GNAT family N-acetyltransferase [Moorea sp. SIOASIH]|uniref:GNAT family N-acetyltransferase n=1 Tax=Moorena sp. SIOASIH TaxID=2607817 RepID=UPI0013BAC569|nr:GNAT family N-acetyltransferase [Moorena sp. SIOASIH]NEO36505.1 GNAT family N-acetyltransferase [Moorena sp. SIOASIH]